MLYFLKKKHINKKPVNKKGKSNKELDMKSLFFKKLDFIKNMKTIEECNMKLTYFKYLRKSR